MRPYLLTLAGLLACQALQAQQAAPPAQPAPPAAAGPNRLDALLGQWETKMQSITSLSGDLTRTTVDKTWQSTDVFAGTAKYIKPNMALLDMQKKGNAQIYERYLFSGNFLYQFMPASKVVRVYELPPPQAGQVANDNLLGFMLGMKAEEAKRRYDLKLVKEDQYYYYLEVAPKFPADKADFTKARLVLNVNTFLPRQVWFEEPNGNEVSWDLPKLESGVAMNKTDFAPPTQLPAGWNWVRVPRAEPGPKGEKPPVIRQGGQ